MCGVAKDLVCFSKNRRNKTDGRQPKCKACNKKYSKNNKERVREIQRKYREKIKNV